MAPDIGLLEIDFPREGQVIDDGQYSIRVGSRDRLSSVEVSIDRGPWKHCRSACGYWWFDWSGYDSGAHQISARGVMPDGHVINALLRRCQSR